MRKKVKEWNGDGEGMCVCVCVCVCVRVRVRVCVCVGKIYKWILTCILGHVTCLRQFFLLYIFFL